MFDSYNNLDADTETNRPWYVHPLLRIVFSAVTPAAALPLIFALAARLHAPLLAAVLLPGVFVAVLINPLLPTPHCGGWFCGLGQPLLIAAIADWVLYAGVCFVLLTGLARLTKPEPDNVD